MNKLQNKLFWLLPIVSLQVQAQKNVLLITADDLNCNSLGVYGCSVKNISPNIDKLAASGIQFLNAHVAIAVSQPSRGALATGRYPHTSGIEGFYHTNKDIPMIVPTLRDAGYYCGLLGKMDHSSPVANTPWHYAVDREDLGQGRDPQKYYEKVTKLIADANQMDKPFYLMVNSHDPHRPWHGTAGETRDFGNRPIPQPSHIYTADEVEVPGFLPDLPGVRTEVTQYFNSIKRLDDTVGAILKALKDSGEEDNTVIMFLSDNGMSQPFSKTNCYYQSTRTPWIVSSPSLYRSNRVDKEHFISGIDFFPTVLDILDLPQSKGLDGTSFKPVLEGGKQPERTFVVTQFQSTNGRKAYPMRCYQDKKYAYIFNPWAIDSTLFRNESSGGGAFQEMKRYGKTDALVQKRVDMNLYRVVEEFYDIEQDPDALHNLIDNLTYQKEIDTYREAMLLYMRKTADPMLPALEGREDKEALRKYNNETQQYVLDRHKNPQKMKPIR